MSCFQFARYGWYEDYDVGTYGANGNGIDYGNPQPHSGFRRISQRDALLRLAHGAREWEAMDGDSARKSHPSFPCFTQELTSALINAVESAEMPEHWSLISD